MARVKRGELVLTEAETFFEAADFARCGTDWSVQRSLATNGAGVRWLAQHLISPRGAPPR
ncbi:hypothetical protein ABZ419_28220 [Streptomyces cinnamoneus]|uniref:hypothetical protein n=1 Tax=Streptomyces cinnamoneus TaxID=53446 RepID=UPI003410D82B